MRKKIFIGQSELTDYVIRMSNVFIDVLVTLTILALTVYAVYLLYDLAINLLERSLSHLFHGIIVTVAIVLGVFGSINLVIYFVWVQSIREVTGRLGKRLN